MRPPPWLRALGLSCAAACLLACPPRGEQPRFIRDELGRALILHGANVSNSSKSDPLRMPWVGPAEVRRLAEDWGFNFARFLVLWDALEPVAQEPPRFDDAYLDRIEERLDWFAAAGIHVVLDMHQDVYAQRFCCDGAPDWAIRDDGLPFVLQPVWAFNYFLPAVIRAFDNFWNYGGPHSDLQDHFAAGWAHLAARFRDHPAVLGYDIMNEPFAGSFFSLFEATNGHEEQVGCIPFFPLSLLYPVAQPDDTTNGCSPAFDRHFLAPFYQRVIDAIRSKDPDRWIFYEQRYGGPNGGTANFLPRLQDPRRGEDRLAFFPHYYSFFVEASGAYRPDFDHSLERWTEQRTLDRDRQQAPLLIGEFGFANEIGNGREYMRRQLDAADAIASGWAWWEYSPGGWTWIDAAGNENWKADYLVRTYPQRVAGTPISHSFDVESAEFELVFQALPWVRGSTEIYLPAARHYPGGFEVETSDSHARWSWDAERELLRVRTRPGFQRQEIRIRRR